MNRKNIEKEKFKIITIFLIIGLALNILIYFLMSLHGLLIFRFTLYFILILDLILLGISSYAIKSLILKNQDRSESEKLYTIIDAFSLFIIILFHIGLRRYFLFFNVNYPLILKLIPIIILLLNFILLFKWKLIRNKKIEVFRNILFLILLL